MYISDIFRYENQKKHGISGTKLIWWGNFTYLNFLCFSRGRCNGLLFWSSYFGLTTFWLLGCWFICSLTCGFFSSWICSFTNTRIHKISIAVLDTPNMCRIPLATTLGVCFWPSTRHPGIGWSPLKRWGGNWNWGRDMPSQSWTICGKITQFYTQRRQLRWLLSEFIAGSATISYSSRIWKAREGRSLLKFPSGSTQNKRK